MGSLLWKAVDGLRNTAADKAVGLLRAQFCGTATLCRRYASPQDGHRRAAGSHLCGRDFGVNTTDKIVVWSFEAAIARGFSAGGETEGPAPAAAVGETMGGKPARGLAVDKASLGSRVSCSVDEDGGRCCSEPSSSAGADTVDETAGRQWHCSGKG